MDVIYCRKNSKFPVSSFNKNFISQLPGLGNEEDFLLLLFSIGQNSESLESILCARA